MKRSVRLTAFAAIAGVASLAAGQSASATDAPPAPAPAPTLADVLLSDSAGDDAAGFDTNWKDYDIVTQAVLLFPDLVAAASDPNATLTAFLPNDGAFRRLVKDLTGSRPYSESETFAAVAGLGDTVKTVLTYHLVPAKVGAAAALQSDGASLPTLLQGSEIGVKVRCSKITLIDLDPDSRNPRVVQPDIGGEASNGFAHGIDRVLRPIDL